jgi:hypothetical protein
MAQNTKVAIGVFQGPILKHLNLRFGHILFFNHSFLKFYPFGSTFSVVSNTYKILRENHQDCIFSYAVSICAWRRKTEEEKTEMHLFLYLEQDRGRKDISASVPLFGTINPYS